MFGCEQTPHWFTGVLSKRLLRLPWKLTVTGPGGAHTDIYVLFICVKEIRDREGIGKLGEARGRKRLCPSSQVEDKGQPQYRSLPFILFEAGSLVCHQIHQVSLRASWDPSVSVPHTSAISCRSPGIALHASMSSFYVVQWIQTQVLRLIRKEFYARRCLCSLQAFTLNPDSHKG